MPGPLRRARQTIDRLLGRRKEASSAEETPSLAPAGWWLDLAESAKLRGLVLSDTEKAALRRLAATGDPDALLQSEEARSRFASLLRPAPGLAALVQQLDEVGLLSALLRDAPPPAGSPAAPRLLEERDRLAIEHLDRLAPEPRAPTERFGSLLRELRQPQLLVLALLLRRTPPPSLAPRRLGMAAGAREMLAFLLLHGSEMSVVAFRQDASDPAVVSRLAALFNAPGQADRDPPEEHLKMLCLLTVAELAASGPGALTPWKAEVLWRLFVDTYNAITVSYGDAVIDPGEAALAGLVASRPPDIPELELRAFLDGLPQRYLSLFDTEGIFQHVRLARRIGPEEIHTFLARRSDVWELTVVSLDKPYLFSNLCGVLSGTGFDILRGQALTSRSGLVLDVFQFTDHQGCRTRPQLEPVLSDVVSGRRDVADLLRTRLAGPDRPAGGSPVIFFDNESSARYTVLDLVADDAPGLLYQVSRVISENGCSIELTLISTEGGKALDVFHLRKGEAKLTDGDTQRLTEGLEAALGVGEKPASR
ncbi:MAG TPA: hypothetical protein VEQ10_02415 [Vicinamibacteria bacterium]|nr:hypothetical protein [Vicinamibacteria bacterium]